jgi:hypothetical protein
MYEMPECLLCVYIIHQLNVCLIFREVNGRTMSTDVENCYIIIRIDSAQVFYVLGMGVVQEIVQKALTFFIVFTEYMTSSRDVCGHRNQTSLHSTLEGSTGGFGPEGVAKSTVKCGGRTWAASKVPSL